MGTYKNIDFAVAQCLRRLIKLNPLMVSLSARLRAEGLLGSMKFGPLSQNVGLGSRPLNYPRVGKGFKRHRSERC